MRRTKTTVTACRLPDEHYNALKALAASRNVTVGTYLKVLVRELLERRITVQMP